MSFCLLFSRCPRGEPKMGRGKGSFPSLRQLARALFLWPSDCSLPSPSRPGRGTVLPGPWGWVSVHESNLSTLTAICSPLGRPFANTSWWDPPLFIKASGFPQASGAVLPGHSQRADTLTPLPLSTRSPFCIQGYPSGYNWRQLSQQKDGWWCD